ncbi:uncharacterized protein LOC132386206, partial [Hypanus sabinus]
PCNVLCPPNTNDLLRCCGTKSSRVSDRRHENATLARTGVSLKAEGPVHPGSCSPEARGGLGAWSPRGGGGDYSSQRAARRQVAAAISGPERIPSVPRPSGGVKGTNSPGGLQGEPPVRSHPPGSRSGRTHLVQALCRWIRTRDHPPRCALGCRTALRARKELLLNPVLYRIPFVWSCADPLSPEGGNILLLLRCRALSPVYPGEKGQSLPDRAIRVSNGEFILRTFGITGVVGAAEMGRSAHPVCARPFKLPRPPHTNRVHS